tara:strand:+ start:75236 stop:75442 length:207 start_codon:yes stop_codon:yes gene_type:complete
MKFAVAVWIIIVSGVELKIKFKGRLLKKHTLYKVFFMFPVTNCQIILFDIQTISQKDLFIEFLSGNDL